MRMFTVLFTLFSLLHGVLSLRDSDYPLVVDYSEHYYYHHLYEKMMESMSVNNCTIGGDYHYGDGSRPDLTVKVLPPPSQVIQKWSLPATHKLSSSSHRVFSHVSENLCTSTRFRDVVRGFYKRAKGCYKVYVVDKHGQRRKRFNDYGATLHPEHVRCDNEIAATVCHLGAAGMQVVDPLYRQLGSYPFEIRAQQVIVSRSGMFAMPCGPFGLFASCEAVKCGLPLASKVVQEVSTCRQHPNSCPYPHHAKVFILTQYDDTQIGQFMQENLPKLFYHLDYLLANPDVKIHFGFTKRDVLPNFVLPHHFFRWLGLADRLINGTFFADEVIMPREGGCQDIGYNAWEMVTMREKVYSMLSIEEEVDFTWRSPRQASVLILTRSPGAFTQNKADAGQRKWTPRQLKDLTAGLKESFPKHSIEIFADNNRTLMTCPLCQAEMFSRADVVIGFHGAGLSNAMFMKPGGLIVEVVYNYDSRHAPITGIFPRIADIIGLHHFSYYVRDIQMNGEQLAKETFDFYKKTRLWSARV
eukprot:gene5775-6360_t